MPVFNYSVLGKKPPPDFLEQLALEGMEFDSGKRWVTFRIESLSGEGIVVRKLKRLSRGHFLLTQQRFVSIVANYILVNIPRDHALLRTMKFDRSQKKRFTVEVNLDALQSTFSGSISIAYHIDTTSVPEIRLMAGE